MKPAEHIAAFKEKLLAWYADNKRDLPFRGEKDPYRIWVSEVLLQQTQMDRGVEYYQRFIKRFPTIRALAKASWEDFLPYFRGLGFYNRGRNMLRAARFVMDAYGGVFPDDYEKLIQIPGVGPYTANAIRSFAYGRPVLTQDTNVVRILRRVFPGPGTADLTDVTKIIEQSLSAEESPDLNQAMMDLGSAVCLAHAPRCVTCPLYSLCSYGRVATVNRRRSTAEAPKRSVPRRDDYISKHPIALIHYRGQLLLPHGKLPSGPLPKGDERAFLKALAQKQLNLEISVRPPFLTWVVDGVRYSAHRCQILAGAPGADCPTISPTLAAGPEAIRVLL